MTNDPYRPPDELHTDRLTLRPTSVADGETIFDAYATDEDVTRYMGWRPHRSAAYTLAYLERCDANRTAGTDFAFVIERQSDRRLVGVVDVHIKPTGDTQQVSYGYVLRQDEWGRGYASEVLAPLVDHALAHTGVFRAFAFCDVENPASAHVMEKAGMVREGLLRRYFVHPNVSDEPRDCLIYAKVR